MPHPFLDTLPGFLKSGGSHFCLCPKSAGLTDLDFWRRLWPPGTSPSLIRLPLHPVKDCGPLQSLGEYLVRKMGEKPPQDRDRLIKASFPYFLHLPILSTWLEGGTPRRMDDLFRSPAELLEERRLLNRSLGRILNLLEPGTLFILENLEEAGEGLLNFLKDNWAQKDSPAFLGLINWGRKGIQNGSAGGVHPWYEMLEESDRILLIPLEIPQDLHQEEVNAPIELSKGDRLTAGRALFQWEDAQLWRLEEKTDAASGFDQRALELLSGQPESACKGIRASEDTSVPPWFYPLVLSKMSQFPLAQTRLEELMSHFEELSPDDRMGTILTVLSFRDRMWLDGSERQKLRELLSSFPSPPLYSDGTLWRSSLNYLLGVWEDCGWDAAVKEAEALAEECRHKGNLVGLAKALHMLGYLYEDRSVDQAQEYYRQALGLRMEFAHPLERVKTLNASGFYAFRMGQFLPALRYFKEALEVLEPVKDFTEICLTIFNIGLIYLINFETAAALKSYAMVLKVIKELQMSRLPFHGLREILALTGISAFHQGRYSHCLQLERMFETAQEDGSGMAFQHLFRFHLACIRGDELQAEKFWEEAWRAASELQESFIRGHLCLEKYLWLIKVGKPAEARESLTQGYRSQGRYGPSEQKRLMEHLAMGRDRKDYQPLGIQSDSMEPLLARLDLHLKLEKSKKDAEELYRRVVQMESVCPDA